MQVFGVTGWKNSGKTTLMERLVAEISKRGFTVSTVKHAHHNVDVDQPGKDSYRHRQAGAQQVILASAARWALMEETRGEEPPLSELLKQLRDVDLVLVEGYKIENHSKIEASIKPGRHELIARKDPTVKAVAAGYDVVLNQPVLPINDIAAIADFILAEVGLGKNT